MGCYPIVEIRMVLIQPVYKSIFSSKTVNLKKELFCSADSISTNAATDIEIYERSDCDLASMIPNVSIASWFPPASCLTFALICCNSFSCSID